MKNNYHVTVFEANQKQSPVKWNYRITVTNMDTAESRAEFVIGSAALVETVVEDLKKLLEVK